MSVWKNFTRTLVGHSKINEDVLDALEETLIAADLGVDLSLQVIDKLSQRVQTEKYRNKAELAQLIQAELLALLPQQAPDIFVDQGFGIIFLVGVNGVGKTTTAARLAYYYQQQNLHVLLGAADTFRAAAIEQLQSWAQRIPCDIVARQHNSDPAAVAYDTIAQAQANAYHRVIIDTAGRLHNKKHLMQELTRIRACATKIAPQAPTAIWLVVDATTGQNAQVQADLFAAAADINGVIITKLDGTAKGGVTFQLAQHFPVPFIGVGEHLADLKPFDPQKFVEDFVPPL